MKKGRITALILLMLMFCNICFASELFGETEIKNYENDMGFLSEIGIIEYNENITATVTRAEFAQILLAMLKFEPYAMQRDKFSDVAEGTKYAGSICTVAELGYLQGYGNGTFGPEDSLTYEQAIVGLVRILGYARILDYNLPAYIKRANELGITKKSYGEQNYPVTYGSLVNMVMGTLNAKRLYAGSSTIKLEEGKNLLKEVFGLEKHRGVVTATEITGLNIAAGAGKDAVHIDDNPYFCAMDTAELLGYSVDYYVNEEDEITYLYPTVSANKALEIDAQDIEDYSQRCYTYIKPSGKTERITIPAGCAVIYNNKAITEEASIDLYIKNGKLVFIDHDNDGVYEVLKITDIKTFVVGAVDVDNYRIYDKFDSKNMLDLYAAHQNGTLFVKNYQGIESDISKLAVGNTVSAVISADGAFADIISSRTKIQGTVEGIHTAEERITVEGKTYKLLDWSANAAAGDVGTLYVDYYGNAAYFEKNSDGMKYGYMTAAAVVEEEETCVSIKIFEFDTGKFNRLRTADKIKIDRYMYRDANAAIAVLKDGLEAIEPQLVGYKLNSEGRISMMDTLRKTDLEGSDTLRSYTSASGVEWRNQMACFRDGKTFTNASTVFLQIAENPQDDRDYRIFSQAELSGDGKYTFTSYKAKGTELSADFVIMNAVAVPSHGIVSDIQQTLNGEDELVYHIEIYPESQTKLTGVVEDVNLIERANIYGTGTGEIEVNVGDVIKFESKTENGTVYITDVEVIFDYGTGYLPATNPYNDWKSNSVNFYAGSVYQKEGNLIGLTSADKLDSNPAAEELVLEALGYGTIYKIEDSRMGPKVVPATAKDIFDYQSAGASCSKVFICNRNLNPRFIYIYE